MVTGAAAPAPSCAIAHGPDERFELHAATLTFVGRTSVGDLAGATTTASGFVLGDVPYSRGLVETPVRSLRTGNRLRDHDVRASLRADDHPTLRFELDRVSVARRAGIAMRVLLHGRLTVSGVTRALTVPAVRARAGDVLRVSAVFALDLNAFRIKGLRRFMGALRVHPRVEIHTDLFFVRSTSP